MSANTLSKKFVDNDSVNLWKMRVTVDKLILLDWNSSLSTLEEKSPLSNLKDILLMVNQNTVFYFKIGKKIIVSAKVEFCPQFFL